VTIEPPRTPTFPPASPVLRAVAGLATALALALAAGAPHPAAAAAADFVVVVNAANLQTTLPASEVSNLFLQKTHKWESGERVKAVDLPETSPARESFSRAVHGRPTSAVKAYWQRMIFSGIDTPPPEKPSAAEVLAYVRANPGAIGYVPAGTPLPDGVKALKVAP
jgi:ABC-type phosphate transport system substrate-binding protein